ncbi:MAG TPA: bifunctional 2-C-methyl-D-erythritol 4-phosphate cytidylyltransferase/2-C-methyl-D-erythritol 2,4-cyclodiphosphate synthase [Geminicoccaceae bacterium]|nr:bifunctional 2-C-methyl-D-erythritol 4-phosphate cytidylyltransferase/2-C-methyl-D-erythritol 2,4-cyclodiphosphate synthase [Geminicoccaceae bacterium]
MRTVALVVAAGRGERFGAGAPKQYADLGGKPVLRRAVEAFARHPRVDGVRVAIGAEDRAAYARAVAGLDLLEPVLGGNSRQETVRRGLESLAELAPARVLVHDAARPLVSAAVIGRVLAALDDHPAALPVLPVVDSLKRTEGRVVVGAVPRDGLARAQTPQGFRFEEILAAHRGADGHDHTDDAAIAAAAGLEVAWVEGEESNMKVTRPADLADAERFLGAHTRWRTGLGFDVHAFAPGRPLVLCGVPIPHELGLAGHSDADVAFHAVTDALLGAIGAGDIGSHFPPSDPRWRDADSARFLRYAAALVAERGGRVENVDLVIVCERPKIGPHRAEMAARLAEALGVGADQVSVKATTSERLGFTGRGEGIAAQAVASVALEEG